MQRFFSPATFQKELNLRYKEYQESSLSYHLPLDRFIPDTDTVFYHEVLEHNIPCVAGYSGHTASLLLGAKLYGNFDDEELQQYTLAIFAFLSGGGNHSFHEVMSITQLIGVPYKVGCYDVILAGLPSLPHELKEEMTRISVAHKV